MGMSSNKGKGMGMMNVAKSDKSDKSSKSSKSSESSKSSKSSKSAKSSKSSKSAKKGMAKKGMAKKNKKAKGDEKKTKPPSAAPGTTAPTDEVSDAPTTTPGALTAAPTTGSTGSPTNSPTKSPTNFPTDSPTKSPTSFPTSSPTPPPETIFEFIEKTDELSLLETAVLRADLQETLNAPGVGLTLFGPTNEGFALIPEDLLEILFVKDEFIPHLRDLLLYHLLPDFLSENDFADNSTFVTLNTERVRARQNPFRVNGLTIVDADNFSFNGVVHTITGVLAPSWVFFTLQSRVVRDPDLSTLEMFLTVAGIDLSPAGELTLFGPTNDAWDALGQDRLDFLMNPANANELLRILAYHLAVGIFTSTELSAGQLLPTFEGGVLTVTLGSVDMNEVEENHTFAERRTQTMDPLIMFNQAGAIALDTLANNGVLYKIDAVLDPNDGNIGTSEPTEFPTDAPTLFPSLRPTDSPTVAPNTEAPTTEAPSFPLSAPTPVPTTAGPTASPTLGPTSVPTSGPTGAPSTATPSDEPTVSPTVVPTGTPTLGPTDVPTGAPSTAMPTGAPFVGMTDMPTIITEEPTSGPTISPTNAPTSIPTSLPTSGPTSSPTVGPTSLPTVIPTSGPTSLPTSGPTSIPTSGPTSDPTSVPTSGPTSIPTSGPTSRPTSDPTSGPTSAPTSGPTSGPTSIPTSGPTSVPTFVEETSNPTSIPTSGPTSIPTSGPTLAPSPGTSNDGTVAGFIATNPELTQLDRAILRAGFTDPLSGPGPFTTFAGTDTAFDAIPAVFQTILFENDEFLPHLRDLLLYNILMGEVFEADFVAGPITTLNQENIAVTLNPLRLNGVVVISGPDNDVSNGVVQITADVLTPSWVPNSLKLRLEQDPDLSITNELIGLSGLDLTVVGQELTLFAPIDAAWEADVGVEGLTFLRDPANIEVLQVILLYHITQGIFVLTELFPRRITTFEGGFVTVSVNPLRINTAVVLTVDTLANNGVLHRINRVLDFTAGVGGDTILDFVAGQADLSITFGALQRAGFSDPLAADATLTFFAPVNAAWQVLPQIFIEILLENNEFIVHLQNLLLYHLLGETLFEADFVNMSPLTTLNAENVGIQTNPLRVNGLPVQLPDNTATNGVTHTLNGLLAPSWILNSLASRVMNDPDLSLFGEFLTIADFNLGLAGELTLLGPNNAAWNALGFPRLTFLRNNPSETQTILAYHISIPIFTANELFVGLELPTAQGGVVTVTTLDGNASILRFNESPTALAPAQATALDILAFNGVLHKIDTVLDPADSMPATPGVP